MHTSVKILLTAAFAVAVPAAASAAEAIDNWTRHCAKCHAADGSGVTPIGKQFKLKNYTDATVQAALKDGEMIKAITDGVKNSAGKSVMPAYVEKIRLDEIAQLVALIRTFKK
jgi:cytochrome c6